MNLNPHHKFIEAWANMAAAWGVGRSVSQTYALILVGGEAVCADEVMNTLQMSRGNTNIVLHTLMDYELIYPVHRSPGSRRQYFRAETDLWVVAEKLAKYQMRRSFDQMAEVLEHLSPATESDLLNIRLEKLKEEISSISNALSSFIAIFHSLKPSELKTDVAHRPVRRPYNEYINVSQVYKE